MYNERKDSFSFRDLIIQALFVILFIFVLIWFFPSKSSIKSDIKDAIADATIDVNVEAEQTKIFNDNVNTMKEAAKSYFTLARLPEKTGDKVTITLSEMLQKKLILPFVDHKGMQCDLHNSYVEVVKMDDEYIMKINLECGELKDYVLVHMGCYNYCETDICEKKDEDKKPVVNNPGNKNNNNNKNNNKNNNNKNNNNNNNNNNNQKQYVYKYVKELEPEWMVYYSNTNTKNEYFTFYGQNEATVLNALEAKKAEIKKQFPSYKFTTETIKAYEEKFCVISTTIGEESGSKSNSYTLKAEEKNSYFKESKNLIILDGYYHVADYKYNSETGKVDNLDNEATAKNNVKLYRYKKYKLVNSSTPVNGCNESGTGSLVFVNAKLKAEVKVQLKDEKWGTANNKSLLDKGYVQTTERKEVKQ